MNPHIEELVHSLAPNASLDECHNGYSKFTASNSLKLSSTFKLFEARKAELAIEDYSVSQTTLEKVFLSFSKLQKGEEEEDSNNDVLDDAGGQGGACSCCTKRSTRASVSQQGVVQRGKAESVNEI